MKEAFKVYDPHNTGFVDMDQLSGWSGWLDREILLGIRVVCIPLLRT